MTDYRTSPHRGHPEDRSLVELLSEGKRDNTDIKHGIVIMEEKRDQQKKREKLLRQEIESLKHTLASLQSDKGNSVAELQDMIKVLRALKREPSRDESKEFKREELLPREKTRWRSKGVRVHRTASVPIVPVYGRKSMRRAGSERTLYEDYDDEHSQTPSGFRPVGQYKGRKKADIRNRRRSAPSPHASIYNNEEVNEAAQALLDILGQIKPKVMKSLWRKSPQTEDRGSMKLLHMNRLSPFLHELVVFAFMRDNPDKPVPSAHRTKPLVQLLTLRLLPYVQSKKYLDFEHFKMFPIWLEKRGKPWLGTMGSNDRVRDTKAEDIEKRKNLDIGSKCYIWSVGGQVWYNCEVAKIKHDAQGEWLVVRYFNNSTWLEKEVQRYSASLRFPKKTVNDDCLV